MDWAMMGGFVALAALTAGLLRDFKRDTRRQLDDSRAEFREAHAQTGRRIDDLRATVVAIVPRASAEPVDNAPAVRGNRPPEATAAAGAPKR